MVNEYDQSGDPADPRTDNPVEALIRHNIHVHTSPRVRFLHHLLLVAMVGFGVSFVFIGITQTIKSGLTSGMPMLLMGVFLTVFGPYAHRQVVADAARKAAAAQWQLDQMKAARLREGRDV